MHIGLEDRAIEVGKAGLSWPTTEIGKGNLIALTNANNEVVAYLAFNRDQECTVYPPDKGAESFLFARGVRTSLYNEALIEGVDDLDDYVPAMLECNMEELFEERLEQLLFKLNERKCTCWQVTAEELFLMFDIIHADINLEIEMGELVVIKA